MALNLPYPNLDFVPLDILTADEMNEIVANYTYIANQLPETVATVNSDPVTVPYQNYSDVVALDVSSIPNGSKILIQSSSRLQWDSTSITFHWRLTDQSDNELGDQEGYAAGQTWGFIATTSTVITKTSSISSIKLRAYKQDNLSTVTIPAGASVLSAQAVA